MPIGLYPRILMILGVLAATLPIFGGYGVGLLLLCWMPFGRRGLDASETSASAFRSLIQPVHYGVLAMVLTHLLAALIGWATSPFSQPLYDVMHVAVRMAIKWGLLWFVLSEAMLLMFRRGWKSKEVSLWLAVFMSITLVYAVAQRYTGIDWTHGLGARLGPGRFAYGVYRISGFMGHPLTLAYNLMLMVMTGGAMLVPLRQSLDGAERRAWWLVVAAATVILLISGSRFVLLVIPAALALAAGRQMARHTKWISAGAAVVAAFLWWEGSIIGRFGEFFDQNAALTERFPRLTFWQVHWRMFLDHPLAGVTLAGADQAMDAYYTAIGRRDMINTAHNVFLQAMADSGIIGLVGTLALLFGLTVSARRAGLLLGYGSGIGLLVLATALSGLMQNNLRDSEYLFALWFFLAFLILRVATLSRVTHLGSNERKPPQDFESATGRADP